MRVEKIDNKVPFNEQEIVNRIKAIITDVADIEFSEIDMASALKKDLGIDSFTALEILASIENEIDIAIDRSKIAGIEYFIDIVRLVHDYLE